MVKGVEAGAIQRRKRYRWWLLAAMLLAAPAEAATVTVDCTGATPGAFTSINAAINSLTAPPDVTDWHYVLLRSNCTENVVITGGRRLWIAPEGAQCPFS